MKIFGFPFPMGNPTIVILMLFLGGIQLISVGILGSYVARIYEEVKQRPKFIVDRTVGFDAVSAGSSARGAVPAKVAPEGSGEFPRLMP